MPVRNVADTETGETETDTDSDSEAGTGLLEEESGDDSFGQQLLRQWRVWLIVVLSFGIFVWSLLPNPTPPGYTEVFFGVVVLGTAYAIQNARNKSLFG
ncbi:hypothetical protein AUR64_17485 [Haloprofundus marisrubri]|uniref:Uncharacterized protein n=1 Tax=Haloprofundus marisrubri TaxID=1514971 RepID=A0A0W1R5F6_9EURY|nr:hypothetical protein [Haloprofundus marisrubri]KTG08476.1 hypothetical protein AUR64_17485 [Haloprofundus marisrubri]